MYSRIYLVNFQSDDDKLYDDCSKTILSTPINNDIFQIIEKFFIDKEIFETQKSVDSFIKKIIPNNQLESVRDEILSAYLKEIDNIKINSNLITSELMSEIFSLTDKGNILKLVIMKMEQYKNEDNIILMLGD